MKDLADLQSTYTSSMHDKSVKSARVTSCVRDWKDSVEV